MFSAAAAPDFGLYPANFGLYPATEAKKGVLENK